MFYICIIHKYNIYYISDIYSNTDHGINKTIETNSRVQATSCSRLDNIQIYVKNNRLE